VDRQTIIHGYRNGSRDGANFEIKTLKKKTNDSWQHKFLLTRVTLPTEINGHYHYFNHARNMDYRISGILLLGTSEAGNTLNWDYV
jgi:hypothetical protein